MRKSLPEHRICKTSDGDSWWPFLHQLSWYVQFQPSRNRNGTYPRTRGNGVPFSRRGRLLFSERAVLVDWPDLSSVCVLGRGRSPYKLEVHIKTGPEQSLSCSACHLHPDELHEELQWLRNGGTLGLTSCGRRTGHRQFRTANHASAKSTWFDLGRRFDPLRIIDVVFRRGQCILCQYLLHTYFMRLL